MTANLVAVVAVDGDPERFAPTLLGLRAALPESQILINGCPADGELAGLANRLGCELINVRVHATVASLRDGDDSTRFGSHVLLVTAPVLVPDVLLDAALDYVEDELRAATVSFLSNNAGFLSIPQRNTPTFHLMASHDERSVTEALRASAAGDRFAGIPAPAGSVHLLSRHALSACDGLGSDLSLSANGLVADFAFRAQRRGFLCAVDSRTFVLAPSDVGATHPDPLDDPAERPVLLAAHPFVEAGLNWARDDENSPTALVVSAATARVRGLRVTIDGRCLGDQEMGTQVQTLALARELALRPDVQVVTIATNGPVPPYANDVFALPRVRHQFVDGADFSTIPDADVVHRPYQPDTQLPIDSWRLHARRVIVTLQDLIAYQVGAYAASGDQWLAYRDALRRGTEQSDGVVVISRDTEIQVGFERLNVSPDRIFVVPNGTDHLSGGETTSVPDGLLRRGFGASRFLFVLGANYAHKNRDLAIKAWALLRETYPDVALVLVGAAVPHGSSRVAEAAAAPRPADGLYLLPDVTSAERNWLLHHAEVVVYPTSAEGFGLVPFEAARFGTPTVNVGFGPLNEVNPNGGGSAETWAAASFASAIADLIADPGLREERVAATLAAGAEYTWGITAAGLVAAYRDILSRPPNHIVRAVPPAHAGLRG